MSKRNSLTKPIIIILTLFFTTSFGLRATDGYLSNGIGIQYKSLAGTGVALHISPMGAATNPASLSFIETSYDLNVSIFNPNRGFTVNGNPSGMQGTFGLAPGTVESESKIFVIPAIAANWELNDKSAFGLALYGYGGMNTNYESPVFGVSPVGVDLTQLFFQPTFAFKLAENHAIGVGPILAYQRFKAEGLAAFSMFSSNPGALTDNDYSSSIGYGARIGYQGKLGEMLAVGVSFQSRIKMGEFDDYAGLFAEQGGFDIPMNWTAGVAFNLMLLEVAFDVKQIYYSDIPSIGNPLLPNLQQGPLGSENGAGFGWDDITVFKIGLTYPVNEEWILRGGFSFGDQPIPESEVLFNTIAPGVIRNHLTFGISRIINYENELSFCVMRAFSETVSGNNPLDPPSGQTIELNMDQWEFSVGYTF